MCRVPPNQPSNFLPIPHSFISETVEHCFDPSFDELGLLFHGRLTSTDSLSGASVSVKVVLWLLWVCETLLPKRSLGEQEMVTSSVPGFSHTFLVDL
jgi:hypothetical protein